MKKIAKVDRPIRGLDAKLTVKTAGQIAGGRRSRHEQVQQLMTEARRLQAEADKS